MLRHTGIQKMFNFGGTLFKKPALQQATKNSQALQFSLLPGKGDCRKEEVKCKKRPPPKLATKQCCPHPPPACASVCRSCPPEKKVSCPAPARPAQPCHCPITFDVKHKPGVCPGPCETEEKC